MTAFLFVLRGGGRRKSPPAAFCRLCRRSKILERLEAADDTGYLVINCLRQKNLT